MELLRSKEVGGMPGLEVGLSTLAQLWLIMVYLSCGLKVKAFSGPLIPAPACREGGLL
jgi:hypothetical protein